MLKAHRRPRHALRERSARSRWCSSQHGRARRGRAHRARGARDRRPAGSRLALVDDARRSASSAPRRAATRRRRRCCSTRSRASRTTTCARSSTGRSATSRSSSAHAAATTRPRPTRRAARSSRRASTARDRLSRLLVRRLADHRRRPLEPRERVAQRLGAQRALAVGQVLRLVAVRVRDVAEVDVERRAVLEHRVGGLERRANASTSVNAPSLVACMCAKSSTGRTQSSCDGDREHVVDGAELAHAAHHLDAERHEPVLRLEPLAQLAELLDDVVDRVLALAAEQEAGMEDDDLRAGRLREPGRVVEHADRHLVLLVALDVAHERRDRRVHGERRCRRRAAPRRARGAHW